MYMVAAKSKQHASESTSARFGYAITVLYIIFEYGRPQDKISLIGILHPSMILSLLMFITLIIHGQCLRLAASPQTSRMLLLLLLFALYVPFVVNNGRAFLATEVFFLDIITCLSIIVFVNTADRLRFFMKCWIWLMIYVAVNGLLGLGSAGSSFLQDENDFAHLMDMMLPFSIFLFLYEKNKKTRLLYLVASCLGLASIVASFSRGGFVGLVAVAFVLWLQIPRKVLVLALTSIILLIVINVPITHPGTVRANSTFWQEMTSISSGDDYNKDSRLELWKSAWEMFKDNPLGVGPNNYPVRLPEYQTAYFGDKIMWGKLAHSIWFTLLSELGIIGVLLYFSLFLANMRDIKYLKTLSTDGSDIHRYAYFLSLTYTASLAGYCASGTFLSVLYYPHYWYLTAMIVATRKIIDSKDATESASKKIGKNTENTEVLTTLQRQ